nr:MAG TPA: hypothetical protein [Caudoviricetes sp.]
MLLINLIQSIINSLLCCLLFYRISYIICNLSLFEMFL